MARDKRSPDTLSLNEARRIALAAQGFDRPRPTGRVGVADLRRVITQINLLQIDYVNVLIPAQYQVPYSRLGPYPIAQLDTLVYRRREFTEQRAREASLVPIDHWPLLRGLIETHDRRWRALNAFLDQFQDYAAFLLEEIRTAGELPEPDGTRHSRMGDFWSWSKAKCALEAHFACGTLSIADRRQPGVARVYDLSERMIPAAHYARNIDRDDALRELMRLAARAHGVGTVDDFADYYRMPIREAKRHVTTLVETGDLRPIRVEGWREPAYLHKDAARPRRIAASTLLSPFDPVVWYRARCARLFEFDYVLEIWVPAAKRRWGYYVLPFLHGDRLVARVDLKSDRADGRLLVLAAFVESHADRDEVAPALARELRTFARWLGFDDVHVAARGNFARPLAVAVRQSR
jgi:uncharacterized protein